MIESVPLAGIAAGIGASCGLAGLLWPELAARLANTSFGPGGQAVGRSLGGFFLLAHLAVLLAIYMQAQAGMGSVIGTSFALATGWIGAALGRLLSLAFDQKGRPLQAILPVLFSLAMGLALMAPFLGHLGGR